MQNVPVNIRTHLIPFFYQEFKENEDEDFEKSKIKSLRIKPASSIGKTTIAILQNQKGIANNTQFYIYFFRPKRITEKPVAHIYQIIKGKPALVMVPEKVAKDLNYIFEDLFRFAFVNTVDTAKKYASS